MDISRNRTRFISIVIALGFYLLNNTYLIILSRWLGPEKFGDFSVTVAVAAQGWVLALFGSNKAVYKVLPVYLNKKEYALARGYIYNLLGMVLLFSVVISFALVGGYSIAKIITKASHPMLYASCFIPVMAMAYLFARILLSSSITISTELLSQTFFPLMFIVFLLAYIQVVGSLSLDAALIMFATAFMMLVVCLLFSLKKYLLPKLKGYKPVYQRKKWLMNSLRFLPLAITWFGMYGASLVVLEIFGKTEAMVGLYAAAYRISGVILIVQINVFAIYLPLLSVSLKEKDHAKTQRLLRKLFITTFSISFVLLAIAIAFGKAILGIYGNQFVQAYPILCLLVFGEAIYFMLGISAYILQFINMTAYNVISQLVMLVLCIILSIMLVPYYGLYGAVFGFILPLIISYLFQTVIVRIKSGLAIIG